jgi:hypothetical protein
MNVIVTDHATTSSAEHLQSFHLSDRGRVLRWSEVVAGLQHDRSLRNQLIGILSNAPYPAYFWETPPVTRATLQNEFEFVLVRSRQLENVSPDLQSFASHFAAATQDESVIEFQNLGGDATLVVPCPQDASAAYAHLAAFSRRAPDFQQHQLWSAVGAALERRISDTPVWTSTSGLGVYWLHIRLDNFPKYYTHEPYRTQSERR